MKMRLVILLCLSFLVLLAPKQAVYAQAGSLSEAQLTELIEGNLKKASKRLAAEIKRYPDDAELYKVAGDVFAVRAQNASIIFAPGLAKKILKNYKKAVSLKPDDVGYRGNLMQFYLIAPGIVGGSKKLGKLQAEEISKLDPARGVMAKSVVLRSEKDEEGVAALFANLSPELLENPNLKLAYASYLRREKEFDKAYELINEVIELDASELVDDQVLLPYRALLDAGFLSLGDDTEHERGIAAFQQYINTAPVTYKITSKQWVNLFLGQLYAKAGQKEQAKSTLLATKKNATDDNLIGRIDDVLDEIK